VLGSSGYRLVISSSSIPSAPWFGRWWWDRRLLFGNFLKLIMGDIRRYEFESFGAIACIGGMIWAIYFYRSRRKKYLKRIESIKKP